MPDGLCAADAAADRGLAPEPEILKTGSLAQALAQAESLLATSPALAEKQAEAILHASPAHPLAELILGAARRRQGRLAEARVVLEPLARAQPKAAAAQHEWALVQAELGEHDAAIASLRSAVSLKPGMAQAWRALGDLFTMRGDAAAADAAYAQHIRSSVNDPRLMRAASALCDNDLPLAETLLRAHLKSYPTDIAAIRMLAEAGTRLGRYADAEKLLSRALTLMPSFTPARHNYAVVLFRQNKAEEAIAQLEHLLEHDPRDPGFRNLMGACLAMIGEFGRAIESFEAVLQDHPAQPKIWLSYGHALKTAGRGAEAAVSYSRATALAPGFGEAYWSLANLKTWRAGEAEIAAMHLQLSRSDIAAEDRFHFHYALGRAYELASRYEHSFEHYAAGAALRRAEITYDHARTTRQLHQARAIMTSDFFGERRGSGCDDAAPIFIVGLPRSGSTLIEQILSSHSAVEGTMELPEIAQLARELRKGAGSDSEGFAENLAEFCSAERSRMGQRFIDRTRIHRKTKKPFFIDKMPNNFAHVGFIHLILPHAKIIDARRHPMATCFSAFKQHFARGQHFSYDLRELGLYYRDYVALMAHFNEALPGRVHRVVHEDLVEDTEQTVRALLAYCGLEFEPACLRFHENTRAVRTASSEQVRRPITREGLDHWRNYEKWLGPLEEALANGDEF